LISIYASNKKRNLKTILLSDFVSNLGAKAMSRLKISMSRRFNVQNAKLACVSNAKKNIMEDLYLVRKTLKNNSTNGLMETWVSLSVPNARARLRKLMAATIWLARCVVFNGVGFAEGPITRTTIILWIPLVVETSNSQRSMFGISSCA